MVYRGTVRNGVIQLNRRVKLPEGVDVVVETIVPRKKHSKSKKRNRTLADRLTSVIGKATGLPADGAMNIDHYLYGLPKRP